MTGAQKWIAGILILGGSFWFFRGEVRHAPAVASILPKQIDVRVKNETQDRELSRLEADARNGKTRADQEAAYTQRYHPASQGKVLEPVTVRAYDVARVVANPDAPSESFQDMQEIDELERQMQIQWAMDMQQQFSAIPKQQAYKDPNARSPQYAATPPVKIPESFADKVRGEDRSWQRL